MKLFENIETSRNIHAAINVTGWYRGAYYKMQYYYYNKRDAIKHFKEYCKEQYNKTYQS